jgi:sarcosine oxidase subunit delta
MRIPCPCCGPRGNEEFTYLGPAGLARPAPDASDEAWDGYMHERENPAGSHRELWWHGQGCRAWIVVTRDTRTHRIEGAVLARDPEATP